MNMIFSEMMVAIKILCATNSANHRKSNLDQVKKNFSLSSKRLKLMGLAGFMALSPLVHAATVLVTDNDDIRFDPNMPGGTAIDFNGDDSGNIATATITGNVVDNVGRANLFLNGAVTINGNIGTSTNPLAYVSTGAMNGGTSRMADGDAYRLNGNVYGRNFIVNNGPGTAYSSTVVLGGNVFSSNGFTWNSPALGKTSILDLQGNTVAAGTVRFSSGAGSLQLISTITADGGQTSCTSGSNRAGCISATGGNGGWMGGAMPAALQVQMRVANGVTLTNGSKYTLIDYSAGGNVIAMLNSPITSLTSGFSFIQDTSNTQDLVVMLTGIPAAVTIPLFTSNSGTIATEASRVLDGLSATSNDAGMIDAITTLQNMTPAKQAASLRRIAPETSHAADSASSQTIGAGLDTISGRLESIRGQGHVASAADDLKNGKFKVAALGSLSGLIGPDQGRNNSAWFKGFGARATQDIQGGFAGYRSRTAGGSFGADSMLENDWLVGAAFTFADTDIDMDSSRLGDRTAIKTYQATFYTSHDFGTWYLDGMLSYAQQRFDSSRDTTVTGVARSSYDGNQLSARFVAGFPVMLNELTTFTPLAGVEWNGVTRDAYSETGAGALSLNVQKETINRVRSILGAKLSTEKELSNGMTMIPSVRASWKHEFNNDAMRSTTTFAGGGAAFNTPGQDLPGNSFSLGASVSLQTSKNFTLSAHVDGDKAKAYSGVAAQVMGQLRF